MRLISGLFFITLSCVLLNSCATSTNNRCVVVATITPPVASSDHTAAPPANQVQFSLSSKVQGNCPLTADKLGNWSTSDPANTAISSQPNSYGVATCINATSTPATITNDGNIRGYSFTPSTLTCK